MLSPLDIHNREFKRGLRGYAEAEVDEFLDHIVRDFEQLLRENSIHRGKVEEHEERLGRYRALEETLQNTLVVAQSTAEEVKATAKREADLIIKEAQREAEQMKAAATQELRETDRKIAELRKEFVHFKARMRAMLQSYLEVLQYDDPDEQDTRIAQPEEPVD